MSVQSQRQVAELFGLVPATNPTPSRGGARPARLRRRGPGVGACALRSGGRPQRAYLGAVSRAARRRWWVVVSALLRQPHGFEGLGVVPVRLYADQLRVVAARRPRDLPGPYGVAMGSSPAASDSKRRALSAWSLESRSYREATRRKYSDRPLSAWRSANLLAPSARASSARASSASRRASSAYVTPATGPRYPEQPRKMQLPRSGAGSDPGRVSCRVPYPAISRCSTASR